MIVVILPSPDVVMLGQGFVYLFLSGFCHFVFYDVLYKPVTKILMLNGYETGFVKCIGMGVSLQAEQAVAPPV